MEKILQVVHDNRDRRRETDDSWRTKTSKRGTSKDIREDIAHLVDDVSELRYELKQLREARRGSQAEESKVADRSFQTQLKELREAVKEIIHVQEAKFDHYDFEISKFSAGVNGLQERMDLSTPQSAAQEHHVILLQQTSAELQNVKHQQEELSNRLASLRTAGFTDQQTHSTHNGTTGMSDDTAVAVTVPPVTTIGNEKVEDAPDLREIHVPDPQREVELANVHESTWDVTVFMGSGLLDRTCLVELFFMLLLTTACQVAMAAIVMVNMIGNDFDTDGRNQLKDWRLQVANKIEYMQPWTQQTLGSRVCDSITHVSLELSYQQAAMVRSLNSYLAIGSNSGIQWGPVMCILALLSWYLVVVTELESGMKFFLAFAILPRGRTRWEWDVDGLNIKSISMLRLVILGVIVFFRFSIALCLAYSGTCWLIATKGIENLLLNNIALEVVLDMDERIFSSVAPFKVKHLVSQLQPWPLPRLQTKLGSRLASAVIITFMSVAVIEKLIPEMHNRQTAYDYLCGGNKDFVTGVDGAGYLYWVSSPPIEALQPLYDEGVARIVFGDEAASAYELPTVDGPVYSLLAITKQDSADRATRWNPSCEDYFVPRNQTGYAYDWFLALFRTTLGDEAFKVCKDLSTDICHEETSLGVKARMFCSRQCGCRSLVSPYPLAAPSQGCPLSCQDVDDFHSNPEPTSCTSAELPTSETYQNFAKSLRQATNKFRTGRILWSSVATNFTNMGCQALLAFHDSPNVRRTGWAHKFNLCTGEGVSNPLRAFSALCPETCACIESLGVSNPLRASNKKCPSYCPLHYQDTD